MSQKIIKPEGLELMIYLNEGYAICNRCGAVMEREEDSAGECDIYICPACEWIVDVMDYDYEEDEEMEWTSEILNTYGGDVPPAGCNACGGPYPYCKSSCKIFED